jgi:hypothetical protein
MQNLKIHSGWFRISMTESSRNHYRCEEVQRIRSKKGETIQRPKTSEKSCQFKRVPKIAE